MDFPLWTLAIFVAWTLLLLMSMFVARSRHLARGGSYADFGKQDSSLLIHRISRAHLNCIENIPLFIGVVVILEVREISGMTINVLCAIYMALRIGQSIIHILNFNPLLRFACLLGQIVCLFGLLSYGTTGR